VAAATSPHTTPHDTPSVTLRGMSNALPDDGVTAPKHVGAVLMSILMYNLKLFLKQIS
jgi:hypothetical protein